MWEGVRISNRTETTLSVVIITTLLALCTSPQTESNHYLGVCKTHDSNVSLTSIIAIITVIAVSLSHIWL